VFQGKSFCVVLPVSFIVKKHMCYALGVILNKDRFTSFHVFALKETKLNFNRVMVLVAHLVMCVYLYYSVSECAEAVP
jgi:hypothetical protein